MRPFVASLMLFSVCSLPVLGTDANATTPPKVIEETFDKPLSKTWTRQNGKLTVEGGVLKASQLAADNHIAAFRYLHPVKDAKIAIRFRFEGAKLFHVGFDPAKDELNKKGHLFSFVVSREKVSLMVHRDKNDPKSKNEILGTASASLQPGVDYLMTIELKGNRVEMQLTGFAPDQKLVVRQSHPTFGIRKPGIVFRVGGKDGEELHIDSLRIEE